MGEWLLDLQISFKIAKESQTRKVKEPYPEIPNNFESIIDRFMDIDDMEWQNSEQWLEACCLVYCEFELESNHCWISDIILKKLKIMIGKYDFHFETRSTYRIYNIAAKQSKTLFDFLVDQKIPFPTYWETIISIMFSAGQDIAFVCDRENTQVVFTQQNSFYILDKIVELMDLSNIDKSLYPIIFTESLIDIVSTIQQFEIPQQKGIIMWFVNHGAHLNGINFVNYGTEEQRTVLDIVMSSKGDNSSSIQYLQECGAKTYLELSNASVPDRPNQDYYFD